MHFFIQNKLSLANYFAGIVTLFLGHQTSFGATLNCVAMELAHNHEMKIQFDANKEIVEAKYSVMNQDVSVSTSIENSQTLLSTWPLGTFTTVFKDEHRNQTFVIGVFQKDGNKKYQGTWTKVDKYGPVTDLIECTL